MPTEPALEVGTGVLIHERKRKARVGHRLATGTAAPCARGRGREAEARGAGHGGTHISSHRCVVARAAPPSPWLPPRAASNAACLTARGIAPWGMGLLYTSHIFIYEITFVLALHCQWGPAARLHTHTTLVTETVSRMSSNASLAARGALWRFGSPVRPPARSVVARDERSEDAYLSRL